MTAKIVTEAAAETQVAEADGKLVLLPKEVIKQDQDGIGETQVSQDRRIHNNAVQCLMHAEKYGDTSLMRRLLVETLSAKKTGYRVRGLINWMHHHSPMVLKGDTINLSGLDAKGAKKPFLIAEAAATPFWTDSRNDERVAKPVYQDTLLSGVNRSVKSIIEAVENTVNGQPVDPTKPYFDGLHGDKIIDFAKAVKDMAASLPQDATMAVRKAKAEREVLDKVIAEGEAQLKTA